MPIYAYRCEACGFAKDVLQKLSDPQLTDCPSCGKSSFKKQVTAAGFQLKGTGWYVTDFRGNGNAPGTSAAAPTDKSATTTTPAPASTSTSSDSSSAGNATTSTTTATSATPATGGSTP